MPVGAKFHKDGRLFITDVTGELYAFAPDTEEKTLIADSYQDTPFRGLNDLVFDENGGLYFTEHIGSSATEPVGNVYYLPPNGTEPVLFAENIAYPNGIALSADGQRVYISEFGKNRILSIPSMNAEELRKCPLFAYLEGDRSGRFSR